MLSTTAARRLLPVASVTVPAVLVVVGVEGGGDEVVTQNKAAAFRTTYARPSAVRRKRRRGWLRGHTSIEQIPRHIQPRSRPCKMMRTIISD